MKHITWFAKAITAFITVGIGTAATYNLTINPWILVFGAATIAGLSVYAIPNSDKPSE